MTGRFSSRQTVIYEYMTWKVMYVASRRSQESGRQSGITHPDHALAAAFPSMPTRNLCDDWQEICESMGYHTCLAGFVSIILARVEL